MNIIQGGDSALIYPQLSLFGHTMIVKFFFVMALSIELASPAVGRRDHGTQPVQDSSADQSGNAAALSNSQREPGVIEMSVDEIVSVYNDTVFYKGSFEKLEELAIELEDRGARTGNKYLQARGAIRRAFNEISKGKWTKNVNPCLRQARELTGGNELATEIEFNGVEHATARAEVLAFHGFMKGLWLRKESRPDLTRAISWAWTTSDDELLFVVYHFASAIENLESKNLVTLSYAKAARDFANRTGRATLIDIAQMDSIIAYHNLGMLNLKPGIEIIDETIENFPKTARSHKLAVELRSRDKSTNGNLYWEEFGGRLDEELKKERTPQELNQFVAQLAEFLAYAELGAENPDKERMLQVARLCLKNSEKLKDTWLVAVSKCRLLHWLAKNSLKEEAKLVGETAFLQLMKQKKFASARIVTAHMRQILLGENDDEKIALWTSRRDDVDDAESVREIAAIDFLSNNNVSHTNMLRSARSAKTKAEHARQESQLRESEMALNLEREQHRASNARNRAIFATLIAFCSLLIGVVSVVFVRNKAYRRRNREQQETMKKRDEYIAMLSHELRNPMATVVNTLNLEKNENADPHRTDSILRQTDHISRLLGCLQDVTQVGLGRFEVSKSQLDLCSLTELVIESVQHHFDEKSQSFHIKNDWKHITIDGDAERILQAQVNLLANASKFSPKGGEIWYETSVNENEAVIEIRDNGIGVTKELQSKIFEWFEQANVSTDHSQGGMGIGLSLAHEIARLHDGYLDIESEGFGKGSTFKIRIPLIDAVRDSLPAPGFLKKTKYTGGQLTSKVILAEDVQQTRELLVLILKNFGFDVVECENGAVALQAFFDTNASVIISDIGMPVMDGYGLAKSIRALSGSQQPYLIALSGYCSEADRERSAEVGFDLHLAKPVSSKQLNKILQDAMKSVEVVGA